MDNNNQNKQGQQLQIDLPQTVAPGVYSNFAIISHSSSEFVVDFATLLPGVPKATVRSRVMLAPEHAKRLLLALQDNIQKYERQFGVINLTQPQNPDESKTIAPFNIKRGEA